MKQVALFLLSTLLFALSSSGCSRSAGELPSQSHASAPEEAVPLSADEGARPRGTAVYRGTVSEVAGEGESLVLLVEQEEPGSGYASLRVAVGEQTRLDCGRDMLIKGSRVEVVYGPSSGGNEPVEAVSITLLASLEETAG